MVITAPHSPPAAVLAPRSVSAGQSLVLPYRRHPLREELLLTHATHAASLSGMGVALSDDPSLDALRRWVDHRRVDDACRPHGGI